MDNEARDNQDGLDSRAVDLVMAICEKNYAARRTIFTGGDDERPREVIARWLDPAHRPPQNSGQDSERDHVMDALVTARLLSYSGFDKIAPLVVPWLYSPRHHARALDLLGYLDHHDLQRTVVTYVTSRLTNSTDPADYEVPATALHHLGLYQEARQVAAQALTHPDTRTQTQETRKPPQQQTG